MKKIAIFTIIGRGPGTKLQNYALQFYLENNFNCKVKTIRRKSYYYEKISIKSLTWKEILKFIINYKGFREFLLNERKVQEKWLDFDKNIHYTKELIKKNDGPIDKKFNREYDYFIVGSDQVWNPNWYPDINYFKYISKSKCIAYAASFGVYSVPKKLNKVFSVALEHMNYISVRETAGANIVKTLINREVPVVIDPTLLLSKNEWLGIAKRPNWYNGQKYILAFFLGDITSEKKKIIDVLALNKESKVIYPMKDFNDDWAKVGPAEFLYLIANSELVLTDSFHGTVFSIIMNRPFWVFDRIQNGLNNMNSRLDTLLNLFNFENRHINISNDIDYEDIYNIDFSNVNNILDKEKKVVMEFFMKIFKN
ncbi:polysaccharide pyruvyl transferase family protein [Pectinatus sottacetonis]|uniref:polysaccharide pyruvyl transferase family protein n=1 Tax=Pectinatus sottacetonis TaxID=1002795 RepID=UPI0018C49357|nr:polysaccharide pyruvyl transferase family protein [Pectinatus sottacetonis]